MPRNEMCDAKPLGPISHGSWFLENQTPEEAAVLSDLVVALFARLDEQQQEIVSLRLQQFSIEEIGERVGRTERTVYRVLDLAKHRLQALDPAS